MDRVRQPAPSVPGTEPDKDPFVALGTPGQTHRRRRIGSRLIWLVPLVLILLIAAGTAAYILTRHKPAAPATQTTSTQPTTAAPAATPDTTTSSDSSTYVSNGKDLNLSFTYPSSWSVSPPSNSNSNDQVITLTSSPVTLPVANGTTTGQIVMAIHPGATSLSELASDKATAAQASQQFAYTKPTAAQHQYPFITFVHLAGGSNPSGLFDEVIVTGITSFSKDQAVLPESLTQIDPLITARFYQCNSSSCGSGGVTPASITPSAWQTAGACQQLQAVLASLQLN